MRLQLLAVIACALTVFDSVDAVCSERRLMKSKLVAGEFLEWGQYIYSQDCRFKLIMQCDGNLVLYSNMGHMWNSNTQNSGTRRLAVQTDGNVVLYTGNWVPKWATNTNEKTNCGGSTFLVVQNDGNVVVYTSCNGFLWATQTHTQIGARNGGQFTECSGTHTDSDDVTPALEIFSVSQFDWKYDDKGSGSDRDVAVWRPKQMPTGFYSLGDVAMHLYDRAPSSVVVVKALKPDALRTPTGFVRVWTDRGSGGDHDAAFWRPNAPAGYTCLGHVQHLGGVPPLDLIRCIKNEYVVEGGNQWVWNDAGSGADDDCGVWQALPRHLQSNALPTNTFISRRTHDVGNERFYLLNRNFIKGLGYANKIKTKAHWEQAARDFAPHVWLHHDERYYPSSVAAFLPHVTKVKHGSEYFMTLRKPIGDHDNLNDNVQPVILRGTCSRAASCTVPMYAFIVDKPNGKRDIVYFFFYPYNRGKHMQLSPWYKTTYYGDHVGDWEHYTVRFHNGYPYKVYLSAHEGGTRDMFNSKMIESMSTNSHIIYSAWGSHANYLDAGAHTYKRIGPYKLTDHTSRGTKWLPSAVDVIWRQPPGKYPTKYDWLNYSGRWGNDESACINDINLLFKKIHIGVCRLETGPTGPMSKSAVDPAHAAMD